MQDRLTVRDIARLSGVGESTVSRVLNSESGMSQRIRKRIEAVVNQHGFSSSHSAYAMHGQSDKVVVIIVTCLDSLLEDLAVQIILSALYEQGYDPIMTGGQFSLQLIAEHLGMLKRRNIDGAALFGFIGITREMLAYWQSSLVPLARDARGFASVCYDDERAVKILVQRLYDQGHRNISYLGVPHSGMMTRKRRHEAYLASCRAHKLHPVAALPGLAMRQGYENVAEVITPKTTALLYTTDTLVLGTSRYLQEQRIDTLQLVSASNTPLTESLHPEIVTVDSGYAKAGRQAIRQLITQIVGRSEPQQVIIPATLP